ncbi:helix-turn-helix domain-containing protein [Levilactobacillus fujinensis]|uniref:Helix-turn-helix domain-containing protein n=1 Tax=Levilactobacillus fujinensis TaxID=2486024 RepID=A0ABW1TDU6_9LACO|nr:helix-turn-helix transcriptional regulator [Levilactobacillus fujinensis]
MALNKLLRQKRLTANWTQEQLAAQLFVSTKTISNWETGKTFPDIESLISLCQLYHLSLDQLLIKGTDIVDDYKKNEILAAVAKKRKQQFGGPILSSTILFLLCVGNSLFPTVIPSQLRLGIGVQGVLLLVILCDVVATYYFDKQIKALKQQLD